MKCREKVRAIRDYERGLMTSAELAEILRTLHGCSKQEIIEIVQECDNVSYQQDL